MTLKIEQETQKRCLTQNDLKMQTQQVNTLKMSEKQLKQENNHLQEIKLSLEKQNNELRKYAELLLIFFFFNNVNWFVIVFWQKVGAILIFKICCTEYAILQCTTEL